MSTQEFIWLDHLENAVPKSKKIGSPSRYFLALEAWRRGILLTFYKPKRQIEFSLEYKGKKHYFKPNYGDLTSKEAAKICQNKDLTKKYLSEAGIRVPEGKTFDSDCNDKDIVNYANELGYPVVLKPSDGIQGRGVFANIQNSNELKIAIDYVRHNLNYKKVIVEKFIIGDEMRVFFLKDKVLAAYKKKPANVVGDGKSTIKMLIKNKNKIRKKSPHLYSRLIKIDADLINVVKQSGYTLDTVLKKGEELFLREQRNINTGGDLIDCTDNLPKDAINVATKVHNAIPGLLHGGIDMIVDQNGQCIVLEINHNAALGGHLFPMEGKARDIPKAIIDYYFPETINIEKSTLYFDILAIQDLLRNKTASEITVTPITPGKIYSKKYIVSGKIQNVGFRKWIKRQALKYNLHGFAKNLKNGDVEVVVGGIDKENVERFKNICAKGSPKSKVSNVTTINWEKPIKIGFEIIDIHKRKNNSDELKKIKQEKIKLEKEKNKLEKKYKALIFSRSWKYTKPFRKLLKKLKG